MAWYLIVLLVIVVIITLWLLFRVITKPKFKNVTFHKETEKPKLTVQEKEGVGLCLEEKFTTDSNLYAEMNVDKPEQRRRFGERDFSRMRKQMRDFKSEKSLAEQIRELPPAIQILLFDRGLARKEYDFKSKKS